MSGASSPPAGDRASVSLRGWPAVRRSALARELRSPAFALLVLALALSLVRVRDQPALAIPLGATSADVVPADALLGLVALLVVAIALRDGIARPLRAPLAVVLGFAVLIVATSAANGSTAFVSGARVAELAVLTFGTALLVRSPGRLEALAELLLLFALVADAVAVVHFATTGGGRQNSFLGEHDYAALATLPLLDGLVRLHVGGGSRRAWFAIVAGGVGCILGGALASLLGFYIGVAALVVLSARHRRLTARVTLTTAIVVALVSLGTVGIRPGELGFIPAWLGKPASRPGQYAGSWSQRLIYTYIGGRIFLDHPILGTGWYGEVPPRIFDRYLPDARKRFSDQPANYFPPAHSPYVPQQTYDEILFELGVVGALLFALLLGVLVRGSLRAARNLRGAMGMLPPTWLAAMIGALAGEALWGGTAIGALFWFVGGLVIALGAAAHARHTSA